MIDIHSHIIPGIDDGAYDLQDAIEMLMIAVDSGVNKIILTPHSNQKQRFENFYPDLFKKFKAFIKEVQHVDIKMYLGMEIYASEDIVKKIQNKQLIGLNFTDYYLIEFPFHASSKYISKILNEVLGIHKIPVIAHPERYDSVMKNPKNAFSWVQMGCLLQVNQGSLFSFFGKKVKQSAEILLKNKCVHFIGTDCHDIEYRTSSMQNIRDYLELIYGIDYAEDLLYKNAEKILNLK